MADNENRGPNDFRALNVRRRREPPIIDASASEVPLPADVAAAPADNPDAVLAPLSEQAAVGQAEADPSEPVLFGGPRREPVAKPADETPLPPEPAAAADADGAAGAEVGSSASVQAAAPSEGFVPPPAAAPSASAGSSVPPFGDRSSAPVAGGGAAPWLLGLCSLALAAALAWVLYTEPQRSGRDEIDDLRTKVAALEARPDPAQLQGSVAALDKRISAADADRAALAQTVQGLATRVDTAKPAVEAAPTGEAAAATVGAVTALAAKVDGFDGRLASLAAVEDRTEKTVADLPKPVAPDFGPVDARVADLDGRITALDGKVNAGEARLNGFDAKVNAVDAKVNAVDGKINGFDARMNGLENRTNGIDAKGGETAAALGTLQATVANQPRVDLSPLQSATSALDGKVAKIEGQLAVSKNGERVTEARAVGSADETRATPIALVGQAVVRAVAEGRPYASDLAALKALGADPGALSKLTPMAANGAPTVAALRQRWQDIEGDVLATAKPAESGNAFDRLASSARGLVQVRRIGAVQGDNPSALVSQVDAALSSGDVPGALAAWAKLPAAGQDKSRDWADAARSRVDAEDAARGLVSRAIATLGNSKS